MDSQRVEKAENENWYHQLFTKESFWSTSTKVFVLHSKMIDLSGKMSQTPQQKPRALHN